MTKALVIGYGVSGKASLALLKKMGIEAIALDQQGAKLGVEIDRADFPLDGIDRIILSPGISPNHPLVTRAETLGIEVVGEIEFAFQQVKNRCVGVTGTNGKTTVTLLVAHVLNAVGKKARAVGNVGTALSEYLLNPDEEEILVVELSSFQLDTMQARKLMAGVYLNLTPDHLDRYPTMRDYALSKARMQNCLMDGGKLFVSKSVLDQFPNLFSIPVQIFDLFGWNQQSVAPISKFEYIKCGVPEEQNVLAAFALCAEFGVSREEFEQALKTFQKPAHRIEWVGDIDGVHYYNDSKGTNIDAVMHAMALFDGPVVLILGGVDKGASYRPWIDPFRGKVKKMIAYGEAAGKMEEELSSSFAFERVKTMDEAVRLAKKEAAAHDVVLLSPGCSSYDQFRNYAERGDTFKRLVKEIS